jgi:DNA mismatch repair ATPase MutS
MKVFLLFRDRDFDLQQQAPWNEEALIQDLELRTLFNVMASGDKYMLDVVRKVVLSSLSDPDTILYRQAILKDCLKHPAVVRAIYDLATETIESERKNFWSIFREHPESILRRSVEVLHMFVIMLKKLRRIADEHAHTFESEGFTTLFAMLQRELGDDYFASVQNHLRELQFRNGVLVSAQLDKGNKGVNYVLRELPGYERGWLNRFLARRPPSYTFCIPDRDENGAMALAELRNRGVNLVANALAQSNDHILSFFDMLRTELAFYVGCLNVHDHLTRLEAPTCFPLPVAAGERRRAFCGLYDVCLALTLQRRIVGNDMDTEHKALVLITGANQGGKSTFLRSIGLSQLMMQCGMFVPATSFSANVCANLFTHYKREEDAAMNSGKLDEELSRMSAIADRITRDSVVLFNESFAATNEREGAEIARQIISALLDEGIEVFCVTHSYTLAQDFYSRSPAYALFLRAERQDDGKRTFKLIVDRPLQTSYGPDLYYEVFGAAAPRLIPY